MGSRTWIKVHCEKWLCGTVRDDPPDMRGVWIDLLVLAGAGRYGDSGEIKLSNSVGLTDHQIAKILTISLSLWLRAKRRFLETERIGITEGGVISITNWRKYQPEYERQKPYREAKKTTAEPEADTQDGDE
jgi:hypothetical protein